jgi:hypothetical protein
MPGKFKQAIQKAFDKATGTRRSTVAVDYTVDNKNVPFSGTVAENKRRAVMKVSNPEYGSTKSVEKFNKQGGLKSQKFVDRDLSGKVIKKEVTKVKSQKYPSGGSNVYATKTTKIPGQPKETTRAYGHKLPKEMMDLKRQEVKIRKKLDNLKTPKKTNKGNDQLINYFNKITKQ